ncbi:MAG: VWA domain-containing protein [Pirellulales bacterium]|nr:VWA domain-containing protein [Pirellulales bacterium]
MPIDPQDVVERRPDGARKPLLRELRTEAPRIDDGVGAVAEPADVQTVDPAVETFFVEVSAGRPNGAAPIVGDLTPARFRSRRTRRAAPRRLSPAPTSAPRDPAPQADVEPAGAADAAAARRVPPTNQRGEVRRAAPHTPPVRVAAKRAASVRRMRRDFSVVASSVLLHVATLVVLSLATIAGVADDFDLLLTVDEPLHEELFAEIPIAEAEPLEEVVLTEFVEFAGEELTTDGGAMLGEVAASEALSDLIAPGGLGDAGFGDVGAMFAGDGLAAAGEATGRGDMPQAEFFGLQIEGRRIVFILDNSGSMQGGRLETVLAELRRCVDALTPQQEFYVIFYSDTIYPLFYPQPAMQFVKPTDRNKQLLDDWLDTVELCLGDSVDEALAAAASIGPDTVFLLSDGRIQSQKKLQYLLAGETRRFAIHSIAVGLGRSTASRAKLELIAEANGGTFRESDVPEAMKLLALKTRRPYHSETPGPVWGRKVKRGW